MTKYIKLNSKNKKILFVCFIIILVIGYILIVKTHKSNKANVVGGILSEGVIPGYTEEEIKEMLQRKADESTFSFEINSRPVFKSGGSEGNLRIANPPYNKYLITVEIKLDDNNKIVFKSGEILPNHYIEYAKLNRKLKAGEHNATATINAYDTESGEYKGTSAAKLIIKVES